MSVRDWNLQKCELVEITGTLARRGIQAIWLSVFGDSLQGVFIWI